MKLVIEVVVENAALDGPSIIRALPQAFETVSTSIYAGVGEGHAVIAPAGVNEPVNVSFSAEWKAARRLEMPEEERIEERLGDAEGVTA